MSWVDRITDAAYVSPSGSRHTFDIESVSISTNRKATVFEYSEKTGGYVQDFKNGVRKLPIRAFIHGENYDIDATNLYGALEENGLGTLEHPLYGTFTVFPISFNRLDNLSQGAGQAIIDIEFVEAILDPTPLKAEDVKSEISFAQRALEESIFDELEAENAANSLTQLQQFGEAVSKVTKFAKTYVRPIMVTSGIDTSTFDRVADGLSIASNVASADIRGTASQLNALINAGASATKGQVAAYVALGEAIINTQYSGDKQFSVYDFGAKSAVNALASATGQKDYVTRSDAIKDVETLSSLFQSVTAFSESRNG